MPFDSSKRSEQAKNRLRDQSGHFISPKPQIKVSGQADLMSDLVKIKDGDNKGSAWATLTLNHPFEKIIAILKQIKDKQSTTVAMKFTIPLVALPIAILLAFQFGRYQSGCNNYFSTQIGIIENINITRKTASDNWFLKSLSYLPWMKEAYLKEEIVLQSMLITTSGNSLHINNEANINLAGFSGKQAAVSGEYNSCAQTISLDSIQNITQF